MDLLQLFEQYGLAGLCVGYLIYDRIKMSQNTNDILKTMNESMLKMSEGMNEMSRTLNNIVIENTTGIKNKKGD